MPKQPPLRRDDAIDRLVNHDQMRLVLAIVEARSFSGAAAALGVSQPSISQQVKRIEQAAGRTLFRRSSGGVALTSDGEAVVVYARAMLGLTDDLRRHFRHTASPVRIRIGMSEDFCRTALPSILWLFMREHPQVEIHIVSGSYEVLAGAVTTRSVDLAVMRRCPLARHATLLWTDRHVWIGRGDIALPIGDPVPLVVPAAPSPMRDVLLETLRAHRRSWRIALESSSVASIEAGLEAGLGLIAAPSSMTLPPQVRQLGPGSGLPQLPDAEFVMVEPEPSAPDDVLAFAEVLRRAAAESFRRPDGVGP